MSTIHTRMQHLKTRASVCTDCGLAETRANVVFGSGDVEAKLAIVAEGPSAADNQTTFPFSGPAGELLDEVLAANGLTRGNIWLTNIIKCRAANLRNGVLKNRPPKVSEIKACAKWLDEELGIVQPSVILCMGSPAAKTLIHPQFRITEERGIWFKGTRYGYAARKHGDVASQKHATFFAMATFNPAYVLRQEGDSFTAMRQILIDDIAEAQQRCSANLQSAREVRETDAPPQLTLF